MTDRELLELAAKAAGVGPVIGFAAETGELMIGPRSDIRYWNPLADDGAALRLAVKLGIERIFVLRMGPNGVCVDGAMELATPPTYEGKVLRVVFDQYAATRRAIVRAAAEIGRTMP